MTVRAAFYCDGTGKADQFDPGGTSAAELERKGPGFVWVHLERPDPSAADWLGDAALDAMILGALDAPETRPRCTVHGDGVLMNLRGVNLSEGAQPEDMVSLRLWITDKLVISVQRRRVRAVEDMIDACQRNMAPAHGAELVARLALRLADRAEPVVADLNENIDDLETQIETQGDAPSRAELAEVRRVAIVLRRFMFPQRDALSTLAIEDFTWLSNGTRSMLREATERVTRLGEELDAIRDRAEVVHDQIMDMRAEEMNRQMLVLSVVAAIFLPLGLITGLLGINVGGMPGANSPAAFWIVCGLLVLICAVQFWLFRKMGLLRK